MIDDNKTINRKPDIVARNKAPSIFQQYYTDEKFVDLFLKKSRHAVDVIIPVIHTNELWRANLRSIFREIPVNRLLLGDGGCIDDTLAIAAEFPRVVVLDQRSYTSLGYSIRGLIEAVETEWFVYLHSDVYLPSGWFDTMAARQADFDWFECNQHITVQIEYAIDTIAAKRAYSGTQMGRRAAFDAVLPKIDDDYLYRNEDIIIAYLLEEAGFKYGKVPEAHYKHQVIYKESRWHRKVKNVAYDIELSREEEIRANLTYAKGIIKYIDPVTADRDFFASLGNSVQEAVHRLVTIGAIDHAEFMDWVRETRVEWVRILTPVFTPSAALPVSFSLPDQPSRPAAWLIKLIFLADLFVRGRMTLGQVARIPVIHARRHLLRVTYLTKVFVRRRMANPSSRLSLVLQVTELVACGRMTPREAASKSARRIKQSMRRLFGGPTS